MKKVALVGCGRISARHIDAIQKTDDIQIAVVCDIDVQKGQKLASALDVPFEPDYRKLRADVVAVLTPSGHHPRHVAEIAECTDIPHILCEKPVSLTVREAHEMFDRVDVAGKRLHPIYQNRYNPLVVYMKQLIDEGRLGAIHQFVCNIFWNRNNEYFNIDWHGTRAVDGGVLYTQASHYVDMTHFFFGEVVESKGIGGNLRKLEVNDAVSAVCKFESGVVGSINATVSTYEKNYITEFTVIGEKGTVRLSGTNLNMIDFWNVEGFPKPDKDFKLNHVYGKGHDKMYEYVVGDRWEMFPSRDDVLSGIRLMERLSY